MIKTLEKMCEICSKFTIKTLDRRNWRRSGVSIIYFEHISHLLLAFLLLTLNKQILAGCQKRWNFCENSQQLSTIKSLYICFVFQAIWEKYFWKTIERAIENFDTAVVAEFTLPWRLFICFVKFIADSKNDIILNSFWDINDFLNHGR